MLTMWFNILSNSMVYTLNKATKSNQLTGLTAMCHYCITLNIYASMLTMWLKNLLTFIQQQ